MSRTVIFTACSSALLVITAAILFYQLAGPPRNRNLEDLKRDLDERLSAIQKLDERLQRLEEAPEGSGPVPAATSEDESAAGGEDPAKAAEERWADFEARLSVLEQRLHGLEEDPLHRGFAFLASEDPELRREGINALARVARFDPEARSAIRKLLRDPSDRVREQAAQILGRLKDKESVPAMLELLGDPYPLARRRALQALGAAGAGEAAAAIARLLGSDPEDRVRLEAAQTLRTLKSPAGSEVLIAALRDRSEAVRQEAIIALGAVGAREAIPHLKAIYDQEPNGGQRIRLILALKSLGEMGPLQSEVGRLANLVRTDPSDQVRRQAVRDLAVLARDASQEIFVQALEDASPLVRREAERAIR